MKAITLHQPYASLVAKGLKTYETRIWRTNYRGPLAIHAAKINNPIPQKVEHRLYALRQAGYDVNALIGSRYPFGAIVAVADLVDCEIMGREMIASMEPNEIAFGDWHPLRYAWKLENIQPVKPHYVRGMQGLWTLSDKIELEVL